MNIFLYIRYLAITISLLISSSGITFAGSAPWILDKSDDKIHIYFGGKAEMQSLTYRICFISGSDNLISVYNGKSDSIKRGSCVDVYGSSIEILLNDKTKNAKGTYELLLGRRGK